MKNKALTVFLLSAMLPATTVIAQDFTGYSNQELFQMREQMTYMNEADRNAYRAERQSRMQSMTAEERMSFRADSGSNANRSMSGAGNGQGSQSAKRLRDGSGGGRGGGSHGHGGGRGR